MKLLKTSIILTVILTLNSCAKIYHTDDAEKKKMQGKIFQEFMDIETVNAKLKKAGYPDTPLTQNEFCEALGVNGVISSISVKLSPLTTSWL